MSTCSNATRLHEQTRTRHAHSTRICTCTHPLRTQIVRARNGDPVLRGHASAGPGVVEQRRAVEAATLREAVHFVESHVADRQKTRVKSRDQSLRDTLAAAYPSITGGSGCRSRRRRSSFGGRYAGFAAGPSFMQLTTSSVVIGRGVLKSRTSEIRPCEHATKHAMA